MYRACRSIPIPEGMTLREVMEKYPCGPRGGGMGISVYVGYKIKGQVDDYETARLVKAKLELICAEYDLKIEEVEEEYK